MVPFERCNQDDMLGDITYGDPVMCGVRMLIDAAYRRSWSVVCCVAPVRSFAAGKSRREWMTEKQPTVGVKDGIKSSTDRYRSDHGD